MVALAVVGLVLTTASPAEAARKRKVSISVSDRSITTGEAIRISGTVKPALKGAKVTIQKRTGKRWTTEKRVALNARGAYSYVDKLSTAQSRRYRVVMPQRGKFATSVSKQVRVKVTKPRARDLVASEITSAPVPSLAGNPAGRLRNGELPGRTQYPQVYVKQYVFGDLDGKGGRDAAVIVQANQGGVGWPDHVLLYTANAKGKPVYRGKFTQGMHSRGGTRSLGLVGRKIAVTWYDAEPWECGACGSVSAAATVVLRGGKVVPISRSRYGAGEAFAGFIAAANRLDRSALTSLSTQRVVVDTALSVVREGGRLSGVKSGQSRMCSGDLIEPTAQCAAANRIWSTEAGLRNGGGWKNWKVEYFFGEGY